MTFDDLQTAVADIASGRYFAITVHVDPELRAAAWTIYVAGVGQSAHGSTRADALEHLRRLVTPPRATAVDLRCES